MASRRTKRGGRDRHDQRDHDGARQTPRPERPRRPEARRLPDGVDLHPAGGFAAECECGTGHWRSDVQSLERARRDHQRRCKGAPIVTCEHCWHTERPGVVRDFYALRSTVAAHLKRAPLCDICAVKLASRSELGFGVAT